VTRAVAVETADPVAGMGRRCQAHAVRARLVTGDACGIVRLPAYVVSGRVVDVLCRGLVAGHARAGEDLWVHPLHRSAVRPCDEARGQLVVAHLTRLEIEKFVRPSAGGACEKNDQRHTEEPVVPAHHSNLH